ncbi:unnamed protein product [Linum trigynum]|uniref:Uncharacterized protein n=1 Tax=Linum trigynum TaxID=586398 RepID=A0AAV2FDP9_9ROSI
MPPSATTSATFVDIRRLQLNLRLWKHKSPLPALCLQSAVVSINQPPRPSLPSAPLDLALPFLFEVSRKKSLSPALGRPPSPHCC